VLQNATWHINSLKVFKKQPIYATADSGATGLRPWAVGSLAVLLAAVVVMGA